MQRTRLAPIASVETTPATRMERRANQIPLDFVGTASVAVVVPGPASRRMPVSNLAGIAGLQVVQASR